jgi:hypothetical protein
MTGMARHTQCSRGSSDSWTALTPKGKILGSYIIQNPRKAVFMTTKELSEACGVSEATVVRFVGQLGYGGYGQFLQALRDFRRFGHEPAGPGGSARDAGTGYGLVAPGGLRRDGQPATVL